MERLSHDSLLLSLQEQLDDDELKRYLSEGSLMSLEGAAAEALSE
jgi:hypothetical protein